MRIYSWNIYFLNPEFDRAFSFIEGLEYDALCLQEVTEEFLERLKRLPVNMAYGEDMDIVEAHGVERLYCVILSPHKIAARGEFLYAEEAQPLRARLVYRFMASFGWRPIKTNGSIYADIEMPNVGRTRVFCLHLSLAHQRRLFTEFELAMNMRHASAPSIVCGDLNVIESARVAIIIWLLGGDMRDAFAWKSLRAGIERMFEKLRLQNPLRGKSTQTSSRSQLDHILVPLSFRVREAKVLPDRIGSDHHPIFVECEQRSRHAS